MAERMLNSEEQFLLGWLAKEDWSAYGECSGASLETLLGRGLARLAHVPPTSTTGVALTDSGHALVGALSRSSPKSA